MLSDLELWLSLNARRYVDLCQQPQIDIEDMAFLENFRVLQRIVVSQRQTQDARLPDWQQLSTELNRSA
ncbi:MAG: hypothetical protein RIB93_06240 [Coleofasciculus sp. D1-CHI-01]|uniref:Uncharacterized protein n=1 Tax=Coleofasciculus chthonoplastes PCC 7420 TaxID=118168 RepID=B4W2I7_9CYAN|nr:hypothetical protein [Coleofasciculus chthonoplastes]EDX71601.1 hypothetical protein MC7420_5226 [Coleofasciculus chthonoplastes PCC 7420]